MVEEISRQLPSKPDAILCSVGGGGLLGGIIVGCKKVGWDDGVLSFNNYLLLVYWNYCIVPVAAMETDGSACFYRSIELNADWKSGTTSADNISVTYDEEHRVKLAHLLQITSQAASLGATSPAAAVVRMALDRAGGISCVTVSDEVSMRTACLFAGTVHLFATLYQLTQFIFCGILRGS